MKYLGKRLRELRVKNDMSQEYVARMIGVSPQAISKWETGKSDPDISSLIPLADLFHVPVDELLDREKRRLDWEDRMTDILADGDRKTRLQFLKDAVMAFPGDHMFRYRLACEEYFQAQEETEPEQRRQVGRSGVCDRLVHRPGKHYSRQHFLRRESHRRVSGGYQSGPGV